MTQNMLLLTYFQLKMSGTKETNDRAWDIVTCATEYNSLATLKDTQYEVFDLTLDRFGISASLSDKGYQTLVNQSLAQDSQPDWFAKDLSANFNSKSNSGVLCTLSECFFKCQVARKLDTGDSKDKKIEIDTEIEGYGGWKTFESRSAELIKYQGFAEIPSMVFKNGSLSNLGHIFAPSLLTISLYTIN